MYQFCSIVWNYITKTEKTTTNVAVFLSISLILPNAKAPLASASFRA